MRRENYSRRNVLKAIGSTAALSSVAGLGSAESERTTTHALSEPPFDFEYRTVGDDVREVVGRLWWLLTVDHDRVDELLKKSPASADATRRKQDVVSELRSTYEVEVRQNERDERELTYHLVDPGVSPLGETEIGQDDIDSAENGRDAANAVADSASAGLEQEVEPDPEPTHSGWIHEQMALDAFNGTEHDDQAGVVEYGVVDPDQWDQKCEICSKDWMSLGDRFDLIDISPDAVEEALRQAIRAVDDSASPHHMYVPGAEEFEATPLLSIILPPGISLLEVELEGAAPDDAQGHWDEATSGYYTNFVEIGHAYHFMQDMSQPLHTGAIGPQVLDTQGTIHHAYKDFVHNNWQDPDHTSKSFSQRFSEGMSYPLWDGSMKDACEAIASDSTNYSEQVYETIVNDGPNDPDDWDDVVENTAYSCIWFIGAYSRGGVDQL